MQLLFYYSSISVCHQDLMLKTNKVQRYTNVTHLNYEIFLQTKTRAFMSQKNNILPKENKTTRRKIKKNGYISQLQKPDKKIKGTYLIKKTQEVGSLWPVKRKKVTFDNSQQHLTLLVSQLKTPFKFVHLASTFSYIGVHYIMCTEQCIKQQCCMQNMSPVGQCIKM